MQALIKIFFLLFMQHAMPVADNRTIISQDTGNMQPIVFTIPGDNTAIGLICMEQDVYTGIADSQITGTGVERVVVQFGGLPAGKQESLMTAISKRVLLPGVEVGL